MEFTRIEKEFLIDGLRLKKDRQIKLLASYERRFPKCASVRTSEFVSANIDKIKHELVLLQNLILRLEEDFRFS